MPVMTRPSGAEVYVPTSPHRPATVRLGSIPAHLRASAATVWEMLQSQGWTYRNIADYFGVGVMTVHAAVEKVRRARERASA